MASPPVQLEVRDLAVERGQRRLVEDLGFTAAAGSLLHLAGPNGSGKTSVLRALAGLVTPAAGSVTWCGRRLRPGHCGFGADLNFVGHLPGLSGELDAVENLAFQASLAAAPCATDIAGALARLGATRFARRPVRQLSAGQRQRVALARLVLFACPLWMLDEPFTALDADARALLEGILDAHVAAGGIVIMATHQDFTSAHPLQRIALGQHRAAA